MLFARSKAGATSRSLITAPPWIMLTFRFAHAKTIVDQCGDHAEQGQAPFGISPRGTAIVIHASKDDYKSDPPATPAIASLAA
jgi:hypothetical protein